MQNNKSRNAETQWVTALVANPSGEIFELEGYAAVGMAGTSFVPLRKKDTVPMPHGSELMFLPQRHPVLYNIDAGIIETIEENPYEPEEPIFPVAAFNSPGYVNSYISAYKEIDAQDYLPLFSYGAVGWLEDQFYSAVIQVDKEPRQDLRYMSLEKIMAGVEKMRKLLPSNRLRKHLEKCALEYGCPAGKNFFLGRYEAPLPTSRSCNANCLGCISLQKTDSIPCSQERIDFTPTALEIAEIAITHIRQVKNSIVSFGQGCEGDPLLAADVIEPAIRKIRRSTISGTINMNTNGSLPGILKNLFDAGLDSIRISINSFREPCYNAYFRPRGYKFSDVMKSIAAALEQGKFVSINYLNSPGFTDTFEESEAFIQFRKEFPINMIQWRNLNFDPVKYWEEMNKAAKHGPPLGMENILKKINRTFPDLIFGYFNPPKEKWNF